MQRSAYDQLILQRLTDEIAAFEAAYKRSSVYRQLKRATELTAQEYGDRFLVELIQNAHDALSASSRDGKILVVLDEADGEYGTLHVANTGEPFSAERFSAICEFAHSSKRPGESIGNKGIGFRSVLQISDWPEIYSRSGNEPASVDRFDGYCFRFARPADLQDHAGDHALAKAIGENVSPYSLPVVADEHPPFVMECAARGFATVVRLPLRNAQAARDASRAFDNCVARDVPLHLFLERVDRMTFERRRSSTTDQVVLSRQEAELAESTPDLRLSRVTLFFDDAHGTHPAKYLVGQMTLAEGAMREGIEASIAQGKLPEEWRQWRGPARVSAGVGVDHSGISRLYNYLPMGETAESPFWGLLDAPFFAKIDRTTLDVGVPLNERLLSHGAVVCLRMASALAATGEPDYGPVVARLLAWQEKDRPRLMAAVPPEARFQDMPLMPIRAYSGGRQQYAALAHTFVWAPPRPTTVVAAERLARGIGVNFLDSRLEQVVSTRLSAARAALVGSDFKPAPPLLADWTERLAEALRLENAPIGDWDAFYSDVTVVFALNAPLLQGRRIILDETRTLQRAGRSGDGPLTDRTDPVVFLAPVRDRTEGEEDVAEGADLEIPGPLKPFVRYAHPDLSWRAGGSETSIRPFFVQSRLVRRFGKRELRELIRSLLSVERSETVYAAALEFAYRVVSLSPDVTDPKPSDLRLRVPVEDGRWIPSGDAVFSPSWGKPSASTLEKLLRIVGDTSVELTEYASDMLASPKTWPFTVADAHAFADFLTQLGVKDGLWPVHHDTGADAKPEWMWSAQVIARAAELPAPVAAIWGAHLTTRHENFRYPSHSYRVEPRVWSLPGAADHEGWPSAARELFAQLVAYGLGRWDEEVFWLGFAKVGGLPDTRKWPSPLLAFLTDSAWVPVARPGVDGETEFHRPRDSWFTTDELERLPDFLPNVVSAVRRAVVRASVAKTRLRELLFARFWDTAEDAPHAVASLGEIFAAGQVTEEANGVFAAVYQQRWRDVLRSERAEAVDQIVRTAPLVVRRRGILEPWSADTAEGVVILMNDVNPLRAQLIEETQAAMFAFEPHDAISLAAYPGMQRALGERARLATAVRLALKVDGEDFGRAEELPYVRETHLSALAELAALYIAVRAPLGSHRAREAALDRLQQVRLGIVEQITVTVEGLDLPAVSQPKVLANPSEAYPTLIVLRGLAVAGTLSHLYAHPLSELAGVPNIASGIELAMRRAQDHRGHSPLADDANELSDDLLCYALQVTHDRLREGRALTDRSLSATVRLLLPILALSLRESWSDEWNDRVRNARNLEELRDILAPVAALLPAELDLVIDACRSEGGLAEVRDRLGVDYGSFNAALRRLGRGYRPIVDRQAHESAFHAYLAQMHEFLDDALRRRFWNSFATQGSLAHYVRARDRRDLVLDEEWLEQYPLPPEEAMRDRIGAWLADQGGDTSAKVTLASLQDVREGNRARLDDLQPRLKDVIAAWCEKHGATAPACWGPGTGGFRLDQAAYAEGWSDFAVLEERDVVLWLKATERWPQGMPANTSPAALGLSAEELCERQSTRDADARRHEQARRSIVLDGRQIEVDPANFRSLAEALVPSLAGTLLQTPDRITALDSVEDFATRPGGGTARRVTASQVALSDAQKQGVGFVGELVVREWIRQRYPEFDVDDCWKSGYKNAFLGRNDGDDALGYDFEVPGKSRRLFEVKASMGEDWQFALAESEVREAQRASADRTTRYRIVFVANALDSDRRRIIVLPNPFSAKGADRLRMIGAGMRFKFMPSPAEL